MVNKRTTFGAKVNRESARAQSQAKMMLSQRYRREYLEFRAKAAEQFPYEPDAKEYSYRNTSREAYQATVQGVALRWLTYAHEDEYHDLYEANKINNLRNEGLYDEWVNRTNAGADKTSSLRKRSKAATT